tara:strand:- start:998 stop:1402 length:405 start_codon:yes stop_codon:yes gene_type:complete
MHQDFPSEDFRQEHPDGDFILVPEVELDIRVMCPSCELPVRLEKKKGAIWRSVAFEDQEDGILAKAIRSAQNELDKFRVHFSGTCASCNTLFKTFFPTPSERRRDAMIKREQFQEKLEREEKTRKWKNRLKKYQ